MRLEARDVGQAAKDLNILVYSNNPELGQNHRISTLEEHLDLPPPTPSFER